MPTKNKKYDIVRYEEKEEPKATAKADFTSFMGVWVPKGTEMYIMMKKPVHLDLKLPGTHRFGLITVQGLSH